MVTVVKPRAYGAYDADALSEETGLDCSKFGPSRTVQSQKDEADINTIVRNFGVTGKLPEGVKIPEYGDFTAVGDYKDCLAVLVEADQNFMKLPAAFRERLDNDPQRFVEFCADPDNLPELRKLGLAVPEVVPETPVPAPTA